MIGLSISPENGGVSVYGKNVNELQSGISVANDKISGTLHYVEDYTEFNPGEPDEQKGNFLALNIEAAEDSVVTFELIGGSKGPITLTPDDMQVVSRIKNAGQSIEITAVKDGARVVKTYSLKDLVLETEEDSKSYSLPIATKNRLGGVKIGTNIDVTEDGTISSSGKLDPSELATPDEMQEMLDKVHKDLD